MDNDQTKINELKHRIWLCKENIRVRMALNQLDTMQEIQRCLDNIHLLQDLNRVNRELLKIDMYELGMIPNWR